MRHFYKRLDTDDSIVNYKIMGSFIARQPNGLLCRFSSVVDTITDYNLTDEEYIEMCAEKAREEAKEVLKYHIRPLIASKNNSFLTI